MNARIFGLVVSGAALVSAAACKSNPTADGSGTATMVLSTFDSVAVDSVGGSASFQAWVVDSRLTPLAQVVTFSICSGGGAVASVANDGSFAPQPVGTRWQAIVTGVGSGATCAVASAAGLKPDTVKITVP